MYSEMRIDNLIKTASAFIQHDTNRATCRQLAQCCCPVKAKTAAPDIEKSTGCQGRSNFLEIRSHSGLMANNRCCNWVCGHLADLFWTIVLAQHAVDCLTALVGADHPYTNMLKEIPLGGKKDTVSIVSGVLWAAKSQLDNELHAAGGNNGSGSGWRELLGYLD